MKKGSKFAGLLFYALVAITVAISATSFVAALSWLNKPFPGFLVYAFPYVGSYSLKEWPSREAGIKFMDRIVAVDGQPVFRGKDIYQIIKEKQPGASVRYLVESKGKAREITLPVTLFRVKDLLLTFGTIFPCGLVLCILSFIVIVLKPNMASSWIFAGLGLSLAAYLISGLDSMTSHILALLNLVLASIYPFANFHLALVFPDRKPILKRFPALEYLIYLPCFVLAMASAVYVLAFPELLQSTGFFASILTYPLLGSVTRLFLFFSVVGFVFLILRSVFKAKEIEARQRARMILLGLVIGFLPPVALMLGSHILRLDPTWNFLPFLVIFFPASIAYSIVRHNLFDADVIIRRTVGYVVVTAVIVGAYALVSLGLNLFLEKYELAQSKAFPILFTLGVILVFNPLRDRIQSMVDRIFFRKEYDYSAVIDKISGAITSLLDLGQVLKRLTQTFVDDMFVNTASIMLLQPASAEYRVYLADGEGKQEVEGKAFPSDQPLIKIIEAEKRELTKYDMLEDPRYREVSQSCVTDLEDIRASLVVPLVYQDKVIGLLNLGEKKSGKPYNRQDIDLLHAVANQGAVAIENARLFQENLEKQRMEEELNIARDLQMSMLPSACPQIEGFTIAAISIPAREVGGDFFDFIEIEEGKMGLVVGDVTGKSVSGALVMAASRSVFRMLSEEKFTVGDIMIRANKRIKKDIKSGMFVALLYAVLDGRNQILSFCSAGQTQPIYFSSRTGEARLQDTLGDKFPLGILDEADYQETQVRLEPGDRLVFYTDGIVEAMNANKEIFGFDRLLQVVREARSMNADSLLKEITNQVNKFCAGAPQSDDLTVIVVSL